MRTRSNVRSVTEDKMKSEKTRMTPMTGVGAMMLMTELSDF
jgi:hypothetical protein